MRGRVDLAEKRKEIYAKIRLAAIKEFAKNGLEGATIQNIADNVGMSKAKLYYYISSKEELYDEVLIYILNIFQELLAVSDFDMGPEVFLRDYIRRSIDVSIDMPEIAQLYSNEILQGAPYLAKYWSGTKEVTQRCAVKIREWIDAGLMRELDPITLQLNLWAVCRSFTLQASQLRYMIDLQTDKPPNKDHLLEEVTNLFLYGCGIDIAAPPIATESASTAERVG
jgi:AcrR family transcriptional regulator